MRRLLPRSLLARSLLIILVPLLVVQLVAFIVFYGTHLNTISRRLSGAVAGELSFIAAALEADPAAAPRIAQDAQRYFDLRVHFTPSGHLTGRNSENILGPMDDDLTRALAQQVGRDVLTDWESDPQAVLIKVQLRNGALDVQAPRKRLYSSTIYLFVMWLAGSAALLFGVAALFMRNQVRAIRRLAQAAEAFGMGRDTGAIRPEGAAEVRRAATAFNRMQDRIRRFMTQRTEMLAGVSHDLRTPLTRMKLALAMLPRETQGSADIAEIVADIAEMERMIDDYLAFARGEQGEATETIGLAPILTDLTASARRTGAQITLRLETLPDLPLRPMAIRRALTNLVDNAARHAAHIELAASASARNVIIIVDDDGPGIPPERRESVFRPFESSAAGGTGLGLTIARDVIRGHGGDIMLQDSPLGGLRARVSLPY